MKKLTTKNKFFLYLIIILSIAVNYNFFLNTYTLIKNDYSKRLISTYGICEKEGYGFVKIISDKFDIDLNNFKDLENQWREEALDFLNTSENNWPEIINLFFKSIVVKNLIFLINNFILFIMFNFND